MKIDKNLLISGSLIFMIIVIIIIVNFMDNKSIYTK